MYHTLRILIAPILIGLLAYMNWIDSPLAAILIILAFAVYICSIGYIKKAS